MTKPLAASARQRASVDQRVRAREIAERAVSAAAASGDYGDRRFARGVAWAMFQLGIWDEVEADFWTNRISAEMVKR